MVSIYSPIQKWYDRDRKTNDSGYTLIMVPEHPKSFDGGWYYEHRLVEEKRHGRILESWETVHHISENKKDCSPANLFVCTREEHDKAVWLTWEKS